MAWGWEDYGDYVSADEKRRRADAAIRKLEKGGRRLAPVRLTGRFIASSFWGKAWNQNLEGYSDYASRLPRGRSYLRQGAVLDLQVERGRIKATVSGTRLYEVEIKIGTLEKTAWERLKKDCAGKVGTLMDLLQGKLSGPVMEIVTRQDSGLFPKPREIRLDCSCPDYADLCKHVAAVLYGVGARLDERPELLFTLRGVDHLELIAAATGSLQDELASPAKETAGTLDEGNLAEIFGIDLGDAPMAATSQPKAVRSKPAKVPTTAKPKLAQASKSAIRPASKPGRKAARGRSTTNPAPPAKLVKPPKSAKPAKRPPPTASGQLPKRRSSPGAKLKGVKASTPKPKRRSV